MPRPYSKDLRIRVAQEASKGRTIRDIASCYNVSPSFVHRMRRLYEETGDVKHKQFGGYRRFALMPYRTALAGKIEESPSATLAELGQWLAESHGVQTPLSTLDYFLRKVLHCSYKKNGARIRTRS